jgi:hypothetical protein
VHHVGLVGRERAQGAHVGGRLGQDHITGIDEDPGDQVQGLLGAHRHHHVVGVCADALQRHDLADLLAQAHVTLRGAVLQRGGAPLGDQPAHHLTDGFEGQGRDVRRPAGQGDDLRPGGYGEQGANLRGDHAASSLGVLVEIRINPGPLHPGIRLPCAFAHGLVSQRSV